ncbi:hypothetical protein D3C74_294150 [compost metagenome]
MLTLSCYFKHFFGSACQCWKNVSSASTWNTGYLRNDCLLVIQLLRLYNPPRLIIKSDDSYRILRSKQLNGAHRRLFGKSYFVSIHTARAIDHQNQSQGRNLPLPFKLHGYRKQLFNRCLEITAHSIAILTANHHKTDPIGANRLLNKLHLFAADLISGYIVKNNAVILRIFRYIRRQHIRLCYLILDKPGA